MYFLINGKLHVIASPIFKSGDSSDVNNYRPISILPVLSKFLERSIFDQLYPFLDV